MISYSKNNSSKKIMKEKEKERRSRMYKDGYLRWSMRINNLISVLNLKVNEKRKLGPTNLLRRCLLRYYWKQYSKDNAFVWWSGNVLLFEYLKYWKKIWFYKRLYKFSIDLFWIVSLQEIAVRLYLLINNFFIAI